MSGQKEKGIVGLINLGNTCYANSILQVLRSIPGFTVLLMSERLELSKEAPDVLQDFWRSFCKVFKELWNNYRGSAVQPQFYMKSISNMVHGTPYEQFGTNMPNDSHEYYTYLLDRIQAATRIETPRINNTMHSQEKAWFQAFKNDWSPCVPLFYGQIKRSVICTKCNNISDTYEIFNTLKITLKDNYLSLSESIKDNFKEEDIDEYQCDKCGIKTAAKIKHMIVKTPLYLSITINRFSYGFDGPKDRRIFTLDNDESLILDDCYISENVHKTFSIISSIDHHGSSHGGHYTCNIKHRPIQEVMDDGPKAGQWYVYDDEYVSELNTIRMSPSTYMIFLRRSSS